MKPKVLVISGPTASGKSELAVYLAKKFSGEVISADSRQVYKGMDIGTGKITKKGRQGIKHYCLDIASPRKQFSAAQFQKRGKKAIKKILRNKKLPIICGGTNFWIHILTEGLILPEAKPNRKLRKELEKLSTEILYASLKKTDPRRAKTIGKNNKRRIIRALEIIRQTKKPVPARRSKKEYETLNLAIKIDKSKLKENIEKRLKARLRRGMVKETKKLREKGLSWQRLGSLGLEYKWISLYLQKKINHKEMKQSLLKDSWRYARKQLSWLRNKEKNIIWVKGKKEAERLVESWLKNKS